MGCIDGRKRMYMQIGFGTCWRGLENTPPCNVGVSEGLSVWKGIAWTCRSMQHPCTSPLQLNTGELHTLLTPLPSLPSSLGPLLHQASCLQAACLAVESVTGRTEAMLLRQHQCLSTQVSEALDNVSSRRFSTCPIPAD